MNAELPEKVEDDEKLARYILTKSWLYKKDPSNIIPRPNAFMPHPNIKLSVYRIDAWDRQEIVNKGIEVAEDRETNHRRRVLGSGRDYPDGKRTFHYLGHAETTAQVVRGAGLDVIPEPPIRHANIVGWPSISGNRASDEAAHMDVAMQIIKHNPPFIPA